MKCKNGEKCFIDIMNGKDAVKSPMVCDIAEECGYDKAKILAYCDYAEPTTAEEARIVELQKLNLGE